MTLHRIRVCAFCALSLLAPADIRADDACGARLAEAERINARDLFSAAQRCGRVGRAEDAAFLRVVGQVRSQADIALLQPYDDQDLRASETLALTARRSVLGRPDRAIYGDAKRADRVFKRVATWRPAFGGRYNPGWRYPSSARHALYAAVVEEAREGALTRLRRFARRVQDPVYLAIEERLEAILDKTRRRLVAGTPEQAAHAALRQELHARGEALDADVNADAPPSPRARSVLHDDPPRPPAGVRTVATGLTGPPRNGRWKLETAAAVRESWLAQALTSDALSALLSELDFDDQILIAFASGPRKTATGTIRLDYRGAVAGEWRFTFWVGVAGEACAESVVPAQPFAVAAVDRALAARYRWNQGLTSNFADDC